MIGRSEENTGYPNHGGNLHQNMGMGGGNMNSNKEMTKNGLCKQYIHGLCNRSPCQYSHDESRIKRCTSFQKNNQCRYGDQCDFSHRSDSNKPMQQLQQICKYFIDGNCSKGDECKHKHVYKRCVAYDQGFCKEGPDCEFAHVTMKLCKDYVYGFCSKGLKCEKAHPKAFSSMDLNFYKEESKRDSLIQCHHCKEIGHKKTQCIGNREIDPEKIILCGLCEQSHKVNFFCAKRRVPFYNLKTQKFP